MLFRQFDSGLMNLEKEKIDLKRICWRHPRFIRRLPWNKLAVLPMIILIYQYILAQRVAEELRSKLEENVKGKIQFLLVYLITFVKTVVILELVKTLNPFLIL